MLRLPVNRKISTPRITMAAKATTPTFSCDQRTLLRSGMLLFPMLHELRNIRILGRLQLCLRPFEDQTALAQDHKNGAWRGDSLAALLAASMVAGPLQSAILRIVAEICNQIAVLITIGHDERGGLVQIPLLHDQR